MAMIDLTPKDRLILANQYKILKALYPGEAAEYDNNLKIIENGYASKTDDLFLHITESYVSREISKEVRDVLGMFDEIGYAIDQLGGVDGIKNASSLRFRGYDGNGEFEHIGYCQFILGDPDIYKWIKPRSETYNSHCPMIGIYGRMVEAWHKSKEPAGLTRDDLSRIAASALNPDRS